MNRGLKVTSADKVIAISIALITTAFVASAFYVLNRNENTYKLQTNKQINNLASVTSFKKQDKGDNYKDDDNDGLANWEEILWDTDPKNPDTDGDGIKDGDEIKNNLQNEDSFEDEKLALKIDSDKTKTEIVSEKIFDSFIDSLKNHENFSTKKTKEITSTALEYATNLDDGDNEYKYNGKDIKIIPATMHNKAHYIDNVLNELKTMLNENKVNEFLSIYKIAQGDKEKAIQDLINTSKFYNKHTHTLMKMGVPTDAVTVHVEMIQSLLRYTKILNDIGNLYNDPIASAYAINSLNDSRNTLSVSFKKMRSYINDTLKDAYGTHKEK